MPAPIFVNPRVLFGPQAVMRMMGVDQWFANPQAGGQAAAARPQPLPRANNADAPADNGHAERASNGKAADLAWKYINFGDAHFGNQKYSDAYDRYRKAGQVGPQVSDAWFRQGFALAALADTARRSRPSSAAWSWSPIGLTPISTSPIFMATTRWRRRPTSMRWPRPPQKTPTTAT